MAKVKDTATGKETEAMAVENIDFKALVALEEVEKKESVNVNCKIHLESYMNKKTNKEKIFVAIDMTHPFDEYADPVRIQVKNMSRRGKFEYQSNVALSKANLKEIPITGTVQLFTFTDKKNRTKNEYAAIEIQNIFGDGMLYAYIPDESARGAFVMLAKHYLKVSEGKPKHGEN